MRNAEVFNFNGEAERYSSGTTYSPDGSRVSVETRKYKPSLPEGDPTSVSGHETDHGLPATVRGVGVSRMTNIGSPSEGYLGLTVLDRPDPVAAVAPHVAGHGGTGHDLMVARYMGYRVEDVAGEARQILGKYKDHRRVVALELDKRGTMNGSDIKIIMNRVDEEKEKAETVKEATINIKRVDGTEKRIDTLATSDNSVLIPKQEMMPNKWYVVSGKTPEIRLN